MTDQPELKKFTFEEMVDMFTTPRHSGHSNTVFRPVNPGKLYRTKPFYKWDAATERFERYPAPQSRYVGYTEGGRNPRPPQPPEDLTRAEKTCRKRIRQNLRRRRKPQHA